MSMPVGTNLTGDKMDSHKFRHRWAKSGVYLYELGNHPALGLRLFNKYVSKTIPLGLFSEPYILPTWSIPCRPCVNSTIRFRDCQRPGESWGGERARSYFFLETLFRVRSKISQSRPDAIVATRDMERYAFGATFFLLRRTYPGDREGGPSTQPDYLLAYKLRRDSNPGPPRTNQALYQYAIARPNFGGNFFGYSLF